MSDIAISVKNLGKQYQIGHREPYTTLTETISKKFNLISDRFRSTSASHISIIPQIESFWALKDISFDAEKGDVLGIIGRNGAGKSTLLKILSRITYPSEGIANVNGSVGSLLEVGTGFHPELTGMENIYLSGSILGMKRSEIEGKFDNIVKFSEIEKFLDTPVKRYSSGMYVRLAFAVAAHLEPDILIVDEVLAVGDAQFQKKCLGKMEDVAHDGRTVLFVSHNMNAIEELCNKCILLEKGNLIHYGDNVREVVKNYLFGSQGRSHISSWTNNGTEFDNPWFKPTQFYMINNLGDIISTAISNKEDTWVVIEGLISQLDIALTVGYAIYNEDGKLLYWTYNTDVEEKNWKSLNYGKNVLKCKFPKRLLNEGSYRLELISSLHYRQWLCEPGKDVPSFNLIIQGGLSDSPYWMVTRPGLLAPVLEWEVL